MTKEGRIEGESYWWKIRIPVCSRYTLLLMKTKVVHVLTKLEFGGAQTSTLYTVEHLPRSKYKVYLFTSPGYLSKKAENNTPNHPEILPLPPGDKSPI